MVDLLIDPAISAFQREMTPVLDHAEFRVARGIPLTTRPYAFAYRACRDLRTLNTQRLNERDET